MRLGDLVSEDLEDQSLNLIKNMSNSHNAGKGKSQKPGWKLCREPISMEKN
jgi:hypothetical protein